MRSLILSQCRDLRIGVTWQYLGALTVARAREFWITWRRFVWDFGSHSHSLTHTSADQYNFLIMSQYFQRILLIGLLWLEQQNIHKFRFILEVAALILYNANSTHTKTEAVHPLSNTWLCRRRNRYDKFFVDNNDINVFFIGDMTVDKKPRRQYCRQHSRQVWTAR